MFGENAVIARKAVRVLFVCLLVLPIVGDTYWRVHSGLLFADYRAFYCATRVAAAGEDPYREQPLHACESAPAPSAFFRAPAEFAVPAPLPGYAFALMSPLSRLPYTLAAALWAMLLISACVAVFAAVQTLFGDPEITFAALTLSLGLVSLGSGETVPLALAALCFGALALRRGQWWLAGACTGVAMIEPHVALPACVALAVWSPRARPALAIVAVAFLALSLAFLGVGQNLEYLMRELPSHAISEAAAGNQYSFTAIAHALGVPIAAAVRAGTFWYLGMLLLGTWCALRLRRETGDAAFIVLAPPLFGVLGGPFIHLVQIAVAIPAGLLVWKYFPTARTAAFLGIVALSVPWEYASSLVLWGAPFVPAGWLVWRLTGERRYALLAAILAFSLYVVVGHSRHLRQSVAEPLLPEVSTSELADTSWQRHMLRDVRQDDPNAWLVRIPTWFGLLSLAIAASSAGLRMPRAELGSASRNAPESSRSSYTYEIHE